MKPVIQTILLVATSAVLFVACNKKSSDGAQAAPPPPVPTCVMGQVQPAGYVCINGILQPNPSGTGNLLNNVQFQDANGYFTGSVGFSSMNGVVDPADTRAFTRYYGQANINGTLNMTTAVPCNGGMIPAGTYSVQGTGNFSMGSLMSTTLQLMGPTSLTWNIGSAFIWADNGYPELNGSANKLRVTYSTISMGGNISCGTVGTF